MSTTSSPTADKTTQYNALLEGLTTGPAATASTPMSMTSHKSDSTTTPSDASNPDRPRLIPVEELEAYADCLLSDEEFAKLTAETLDQEEEATEHLPQGQEELQEEMRREHSMRELLERYSMNADEVEAVLENLEDSEASRIASCLNE